VKDQLSIVLPIDTANIGSDRRSLYDVLTKQFVTVILVKFTLVTLILKNRLRISSFVD
jgi:hypothetical protein